MGAELDFPDGFSADCRTIWPIVLEAGRLAEQHFVAWHGAPSGLALPVEWKDSDEPVTLADRAISQLCVSRLRAAFPHDAVVSEEEPDDGARLAAPRTWLVDPIDGTKDFIAGRPGFSVMIGLVQHGVPVVGVVFQPSACRLWLAEKGRGAVEIVEQQKPRKISVSSVSDMAAARMVSSASSRPALVEHLRDRVGIRDEVQVGSVGVKLCLIAAARRDLYVNPGSRCKWWDTAAPEVILTEAGGKLTNLRGAALRYEGRGLGHLGGLVASNGVLHPESLRVLSQLL